MVVMNNQNKTIDSSIKKNNDLELILKKEKRWPIN